MVAVHLFKVNWSIVYLTWLTGYSYVASVRSLLDAHCILTMLG